jgi:Na+/H+ antiporter NhaB
MKKLLRQLSMLVGIVGLVLLVLAVALHLTSPVGLIGLVLLIIAAIGGLVSAFLTGKRSDDIGSYRIPRT